MGLLLFKTVTIIISAILIWQDYKTRFVNGYLLLALLAANLAYIFFLLKSAVPLESILLNLMFLAVLIIVLWVYTRLRFKGKVSFFQEAFALGDIGYLIAVLPLFTFHGFVLFFTGASICAIITTLLISRKEDVQKVQIPFVSYMGCFFIILVGLSFIPKENFRFFTELIWNFNLILFKLP